MFQSLALPLIALAMLVVCWWVCVEYRLRAEEVRRRAREWDTPGTAFDASAIIPQIRDVRRDYLTSIQSRPRHDAYHRDRLAAAQREVEGLTYFRRRRADPEMNEHLSHDVTSIGDSESA